MQSFRTVTRPAMQHTIIALSVQDMLKNNVVTTILSGTPAMFTSGVMTTTALYTGQIVMTQVGKTVTVSSTVQVGNRQLTQQQVLKQHTILKQNQCKQRLAISSNAGGLPPPAR